MTTSVPAKITPQEAAQELLFRQRARESFAEYIHYVTGMPVPWHVKILCERLERLMQRKITHHMSCWPPGHIKSGTCSWRFPAYYLSKFTNHSVIFVTHTQDFADIWGRRVRNLIMSEEHQALFPEIQIAEDSRAAARWETNKGGTYFAVGVGGAVTGKRSHAVILDDLVSGQEAAASKTQRDTMWEWYGADLLTRALPNCVYVIINTRWHLDDISGRLLDAEKRGGQKWDKLILPAIAEKGDPIGRQEGEALWPDVFSKKILENIQRQPAMTASKWASLYQQNPVVEGGNIVKRAWIKIWPYRQPPRLDYVLQTWDTAITKKDSAAASVCLTLGVFKEPDTELPAVILLSRWRGQVEYPELRKMAQRLAADYLDDNIDRPLRIEDSGRVPDVIYIEDVPAGRPLISDLMRAGVGAIPFRPARYGDKTARLNLILDIIENGRYYVPGSGTVEPYTQPRRWADEHITMLCAFPKAASRDDADALSQGLIMVKQRGLVRNTEDPKEPERGYVTQPRGAMYG